jgi:hypothetical protein
MSGTCSITGFCPIFGGANRQAKGRMGMKSGGRAAGTALEGFPAPSALRLYFSLGTCDKQRNIGRNNTSKGIV